MFLLNISSVIVLDYDSIIQQNIINCKTHVNRSVTSLSVLSSLPIFHSLSHSIQDRIAVPVFKKANAI